MTSYISKIWYSSLLASKNLLGISTQCKTIRISFQILMLLVIVFLIFSCKKETTNFKAQYRDITEAVYSTATVQPRQMYTVYPPVNGIIDYSDLEEGKIIKKGNQLFQIKNHQSGLNQANARLNYEIAKETYQGRAAILRELEEGIVAYYSNRCPFAEFHTKNSLIETAKARNLPLKIIKLETVEQAQSAPSPATIFSLFLDGKFITTDLSVCMNSRFDKVIDKALK